MENNRDSNQVLKQQIPDIKTPEYRRRRRDIMSCVNEEKGLQGMARSQRLREYMIDGVKQEITKQKANPKYRENEGIRYLERQLDFGEKQQREYREFKNIKDFFKERMRQ